MGKKQREEIKKPRPKMNWFLIIALVFVGALLIGVIVSYVWEISMTALLYNILKLIFGRDQ
jgi:hypothetical protein